MTKSALSIIIKDWIYKNIKKRSEIFFGAKEQWIYGNVFLEIIFAPEK